MKRRKERLTVTVDGALLRAANEAVAAGRADSLSGWVNLALAERAAKERRLLAVSEAVAAYIDAALVLLARDGDTIVTSDMDDIAALAAAA